MEFNSLEEMIRYIQNASDNSANECAKEMKETLEEEIHNQVRGWDGYLFNAVSIVSDSPENIEVEISDNQGWTSLRGKNAGQSFRNAMYGLEGGHTWNREKSNIMEESENKLETKLPKAYKDSMKNKGIPIV